MLFVAGENLVPIIVALLIGFIAGLWIWKFARRRDDEVSPILTEEPMRRPYMEIKAADPPLNLGSLTRDEEDDRPVPTGPRAEPEVLARRSRVVAVDENDLGSGPASAIEDVAGQFLGIDAHPGPTGAASGTVGGPAGDGDDLQTMKGVGPKLAGLLRAEGILRFEQIAALTPGDLARLDAHLGAFKGRLARDRIVEQAAFLAAGDRAGYERAFGRL